MDDWISSIASAIEARLRMIRTQRAFPEYFCKSDAIILD